MTKRILNLETIKQQRFVKEMKRNWVVNRIIQAFGGVFENLEIKAVNGTFTPDVIENMIVKNVHITIMKYIAMNVLDNFLLNAIAGDPDVCEPFFKEVLSVLLQREIGEIVVRAQSYIPGDTPDMRGIQLDVEIWEDNNCLAKCRLYNLEAQQYAEAYLEKRSRFYQAKKDSKHLKRGEKNWGKLPDQYMIMITTFDPFGEDSVIYTFENTCKEYPNVEYNDGLKFIYFNTSGTKGGTEAIKQLLSYLKESKIEDVKSESTSQIHNYVTTIKQSAEVRNSFMTLGEYLDRLKEEEIAAEIEAVREKVRAEAKAEGRADSIEEFFSQINIKQGDSEHV